MATDKTTYVQVRGFVEWARVFEFNREMPEDATDKKVRKGLEAVKGMYKLNFYPATAEEKQKLINAGMSLDLYNSDKPRFQKGSDLGIGEFVVLKRPHEKLYTNKEGETINFGGPPPIVYFPANENGEYKKFDPETDGLIGNGTEVMLKVSIYGDDTAATIRFEKIGIINLVSYQSNNSNSGF